MSPRKKSAVVVLLLGSDLEGQREKLPLINSVHVSAEWPAGPLLHGVRGQRVDGPGGERARKSSVVIGARTRPRNSLSLPQQIEKKGLREPKAKTFVAGGDFPAFPLFTPRGARIETVIACLLLVIPENTHTRYDRVQCLPGVPGPDCGVLEGGRRRDGLVRDGPGFHAQRADALSCKTVNTFARCLATGNAYLNPRLGSTGRRRARPGGRPTAWSAA